MSYLIAAIVAVYLAGFVVTFAVHVTFLQMVTPGLAVARAAAWPIFITTGRPHGTPLPMD